MTAPVIRHSPSSRIWDLGFCHFERSAVSASGGRNLNPIKSKMEIPRRSLRRFPRNDKINLITLFIVHFSLFIKNSFSPSLFH